MRLPEDLRIAGVEHTSVTLDGFDAHVATAGPVDGPAVAVVRDLRGFGWSGTPGCGYTSAQFTKDLFALLDALGLGLVRGHARVAASVALYHDALLHAFATPLQPQ